MSRVLCLCCGLALSWLVLAGNAEAHALLLSSAVQPAADAQAAADIALHYNSRIDASRSRLTLTDSQGAKRTLAALPGDDLATLRTRADGLTPGAFTLRWEVLSVDGHISRGEINFTYPLSQQ